MWCQEEEKLMLELVKAQRHLWDPRHALYSKQTLRKKSFDEIAAKLRVQFSSLQDLNGDGVRLKFKNIKTYYIQQLKKVQQASSRSGTASRSKWHLYNAADFLSDSVAVTETKPTAENTETEDPFFVHTFPCKLEDETITKVHRSPTPSSDRSPSPASIHTGLEAHESPATSIEVQLDSDIPLSPDLPGKRRRVTRPLEAHKNALSFLKQAIQGPQKEDIPYATSVIVREMMSEFPSERHVSMLAKIAVFLDKLREEELRLREQIKK